MYVSFFKYDDFGLLLGELMHGKSGPKDKNTDISFSQHVQAADVD
jgi:hypothetical protein